MTGGFGGPPFGSVLVLWDIPLLGNSTISLASWNVARPIEHFGTQHLCLQPPGILPVRMQPGRAWARSCACVCILSLGISAVYPMKTERQRDGKHGICLVLNPPYPPAPPWDTTGLYFDDFFVGVSDHSKRSSGVSECLAVGYCFNLYFMFKACLVAPRVSQGERKQCCMHGLCTVLLYTYVYVCMRKWVCVTVLFVRFYLSVNHSFLQPPACRKEV